MHLHWMPLPEPPGAHPARAGGMRNRLHSEMRAIEIVEAKERNSPLVGRYFKYRNTYGFGESWWLYLKVIGLEDSAFRVVQFEITETGRHEACATSKMSLDNWQSITLSEYAEAFSSFINSLVELSTK